MAGLYRARRVNGRDPRRTATRTDATKNDEEVRDASLDGLCRSASRDGDILMACRASGRWLWALLGAHAGLYLGSETKYDVADPRAR